MSSFSSYFTAGVAALASSLVVATGASAQTALTNGVTLMTGAPPVANYNSINLGSTPGTGWVTQMPLSLNYSGVNLDVSFTGGGGVAQSNGSWNPTPGSNYFFSPGSGGSVTFAFSAAQRYFGFAWSSPDDLNRVQFYNGGSLLASMSGSQFRSAAGLQSRAHIGTYAGFSFSELAFDRVVMTGGTNSGFEAGGVTFASTAPEVAPIPLGGVGGMVALLGMFALRRGHGGLLPQRLLAFASGGRRQQVQRFA
jgi:hypothetical protein